VDPPQRISSQDDGPAPCVTAFARGLARNQRCLNHLVPRPFNRDGVVREAILLRRVLQFCLYHLAAQQNLALESPDAAAQCTQLVVVSAAVTNVRPASSLANLVSGRVLAVPAHSKRLSRRYKEKLRVSSVLNENEVGLSR